MEERETDASQLDSVSFRTDSPKSAVNNDTQAKRVIVKVKKTKL